MTIGRAHSGGSLAVEGVLPFIEIVHNRSNEDLTLSGSDQNVVWFATPNFNTMGGAVTFDAVDEVTIVDSADYRIDYGMTLNTTGSSRFVMTVERDPLGVGAFAFIVLSSVFYQSLDAGAQNGTTFTIPLISTDILRCRIRRLVGTGPDRTDGVNGGIWRLTKMS